MLCINCGLLCSGAFVHFLLRNELVLPAQCTSLQSTYRSDGSRTSPPVCPSVGSSHQCSGCPGAWALPVNPHGSASGSQKENSCCYWPCFLGSITAAILHLVAVAFWGFFKGFHCLLAIPFRSVCGSPMMMALQKCKVIHYILVSTVTMRW